MPHSVKPVIRCKIIVEKEANSTAISVHRTQFRRHRGTHRVLATPHRAGSAATAMSGDGDLGGPPPRRAPIIVEVDGGEQQQRRPSPRAQA